MKNPFPFGLAAILAWLAGAGANMEVEIANGGRMPVLVAGCWPDLKLDPRHVCLGPLHSNLFLLCDWIRIGNDIYSPGDFLLFLGQAMCVVFVFMMGFSIVQELHAHRPTNS